MKRVISTVVVICLSILFLTSCEKEIPSEKKIITGHDYIIYEDTIYYIDRYTQKIRYQILGNIQETGLPLAGDALAMDDDNPFSRINSAMMLVDEAATKANEGQPVLIFALKSADEENYQILSYNTKDSRLSVLKEDITGPVQTLHLYGEYILYTTNDGELGCNVHSLKKDGSACYTLPNPEHQIYIVKNCYNDEIYIESPPSLYKASMTLENLTFLFDNYDTPVFFSEKYLYYREYDSQQLCRRTLADLSQNEVFLEEKTVGITRGNSYLYLKEAKDSGDFGKEKYDMVYLYNASTDENRLIFQNTEPDVMYLYMDFSDQYILFDCNYISGDKVGVKEFMVYNIGTQEKLYIPY